jgi:acyl-[acyl-carrier-protein]-phospholipid O-acyltransferase/long-chain-fatty-acid--[acyl-carrier-protein] ligase
MISLSEIEQRVRTALNNPDLALVAVNLPDAKKGEKVILLLEGEHDVKDVRQQLVAAKLPNLQLPSAIHAVKKLPVLGSGKTDFASSKKIAQQLS